MSDKKIAAVKLLCQSKKCRGTESPYNECSNHFYYEDFISDVDAIGVAKLLVNRQMTDESHVFSDILSDYYQNHIGERKQNLLLDILGIEVEDLTLESLARAIKIAEETGIDSSIVYEYPDLQIQSYDGLLNVMRLLGDGAGIEAREAVYYAFARYVLSETEDMRI